MYVENEQPSYTAVFYVITCYTIPTSFADTVISMAVVTPAITLRKKTVTPLNSTNSCQQMALIAIPPIANYRTKFNLQMLLLDRCSKQ